MENLRNLTIEELEKVIVDFGEQKYRAKQIYEWLHKHRVTNLDEMLNVGKVLKQKILSSFDVSFPKIEKEFISKLDDTKKYLICLNDNNLIESVLMKYKFGYTICISSEVGCDMGCKFCASTIGGMKRNLRPYELLSQIYLIANHNNINITNIVIMGSGEPLCNYDNIIKFLHIINSEEGQNISLRNVTISTCGVVPMIKKLANEKLPITLALSLHAPNDDIRKTIMPIANKYSLKETLEAMSEYYISTNRRITFEYSLVKNVNDSKENAIQLVELFNDNLRIKHIDFNVNLIPVNEVKESSCERPDKERVFAFKNLLENNGINVTIRRELGKDISGSCGQLRAGVK